LKFKYEYTNTAYDVIFFNSLYVKSFWTNVDVPRIEIFLRYIIFRKIWKNDLLKYGRFYVEFKEYTTRKEKVSPEKYVVVKLI